MTERVRKKEWHRERERVAQREGERVGQRENEDEGDRERERKSGTKRERVIIHTLILQLAFSLYIPLLTCQASMVTVLRFCKLCDIFLSW